ncbi:MAG: B12-binding domain-containing protein [Deltaproteobacteria bacterium]|jgi:methanogenic corrinoid protein MtbC1
MSRPRQSSWTSHGPLARAGGGVPPIGILSGAEVDHLLATTVLPVVGVAVRGGPTDAETREIVDRALEGDVPALSRIVAGMAAAGLTRRTVLLDGIAPAARLLGQLWCEDELTWMDTTLGLSTLERLLVVLAHGTPPCELARTRGLVILFAEPGEQHTLSIRILAELFREAGFGTHVEPSMTHEGVVAVVRREHVVMVGMTTTTRSHADAMHRLVDDVRRFSRNPNVLFVVGGPRENIGYAQAIGADYCTGFEDALARLGATGRGAGSLE